jgi:hypothetical protein
MHDIPAGDGKNANLFFTAQYPKMLSNANANTGKINNMTPYLLVPFIIKT